MAVLLAVFTGGDPGDIAKDATEVLHGSKAGIEGYAGDFQLGVLEQLGRLLEPAGVEPLADGLPGGRLCRPRIRRSNSLVAKRRRTCTRNSVGRAVTAAMLPMYF